MKEDIEAQGKLKRARLESAKNNSQLMGKNIEELGNAELRDSQVQTKVMLKNYHVVYTPFLCTVYIWFVFALTLLPFCTHPDAC